MSKALEALIEASGILDEYRGGKISRKVFRRKILGMERMTDGDVKYLLKDKGYRRFPQWRRVVGVSCVSG